MKLLLLSILMTKAGQALGSIWQLYLTFSQFFPQVFEGLYGLRVQVVTTFQWRVSALFGFTFVVYQWRYDGIVVASAEQWKGVAFLLDFAHPVSSCNELAVAQHLQHVADIDHESILDQGNVDPFTGVHDSWYEIEWPDFLGSVGMPVNRKGDAEISQQHFGRLLTAPEIVCRQCVEFFGERLAVLTGLSFAAEHLIKADREVIGFKIHGTPRFGYLAGVSFGQCPSR